MSNQVMPLSQQSSRASQAQWQLNPGEVLRLRAGPGARELHATHGRLWLTREGTALEPSTDLWLEAGDDATLPQGSVWVIEAWADARFQLLVPPQACAQTQGLLSRLGAWMHGASSSLPASSLNPVAR